MVACFSNPVLEGLRWEDRTLKPTSTFIGISSSSGLECENLSQKQNKNAFFLIFLSFHICMYILCIAHTRYSFISHILNILSCKD